MDYMEFINTDKKKEIYIFYLNNIFIGVTSVLFHGTLSIEVKYWMSYQLYYIK